MIEEPHLGRLMTKIHGPVKPATERLEFGGLDHTTVLQKPINLSTESTTSEARSCASLHSRDTAHPEHKGAQ